MQISRHWRMNAQRYRLEGVRYEDGHCDLEARPAVNPAELEQTGTLLENTTRESQPEVEAAFTAA